MLQHLRGGSAHGARLLLERCQRRIPASLFGGVAAQSIQYAHVVSQLVSV